MITISVGLRGALFILYLIVEMGMINLQKRTIIGSIIPYIILVRSINRQLPWGWKVKAFEGFIFMWKTKFIQRQPVYNSFIRLESKVIKKSSQSHSSLGISINGNILFNWKGQMLDDTQLKMMIWNCNKKNEVVKAEIRENKLEELGIN